MDSPAHQNHENDMNEEQIAFEVQQRMLKMVARMQLQSTDASSCEERIRSMIDPLGKVKARVLGKNKKPPVSTRCRSLVPI